jgi:hypothetical protein
MPRLSAAFLLLASLTLAQRPNTNYDEAAVKSYKLPDLLGSARTAADWTAKRRPEIMSLFAGQVYGRIPTARISTQSTVTASGETPDGMGTWKQVRIDFASKTIPPLNVLLLLPKGVTGRVPVFVTLSFTPTHTLLPDKSIPLTTRWIRGGQPPTEAQRGTETGRWPWPLILGNGFGVAVAYYGDLFEDKDDGLANSIIPGVEKERTDVSWNALAAWGWGMSRILDLLEQEPAVDARHTAVVGHSRLGKAALWAGASDERFAIVISNDSGEGGASLARRNFGEHVADLNKSFPHWFTANYRKYSSDPGEMPVDQHQLLAAMAPRPVYVASAEDDKWADPRGEFLALEAASPAYELFGIPSLKGVQWPAPNHPVIRGRQGYHVRTGKHDINAYDWQQYIAFARRMWGE